MQLIFILMLSADNSKFNTIVVSHGCISEIMSLCFFNSKNGIVYAIYETFAIKYVWRRMLYFTWIMHLTCNSRSLTIFKMHKQTWNNYFILSFVFPEQTECEKLIWSLDNFPGYPHSGERWVALVLCIYFAK